MENATQTEGDTPRAMTGGMAIVEALIANGVETVFGLPGAQLYPLFDALQQRRNRIRTIGARHEQACGYMAFGYARSTGRPGIYAVVPGPGMLNTTAALSTAWGCNTPVVCVTGQVPSQFLGKRRGHLHEIPDQLGTLRSLVKWAGRIERPADAPRVIDEAFRQMLGGRPGPVAVEMCWDAMAASEEVELLPRAAIPPPPMPSQTDVEAAARLVEAARYPMIMTGSGAQGASAQVKALAELIDAPVAAFRGGRGVVAEDHPLGVSSYAARLMWPETDVLIGIGTRLEMPYMRWAGMMRLIDRPTAPPHLIRIDIDPEEMSRLAPHAGIVADAADGTTAITESLRALGCGGEASASRRERVAKAKADARAAITGVQPQLAYLDVIREALPRDGFLVPELSQVGFTSYFGFDVYEPRTYVSEGFQGTLGFGFPTALGVKAANPDRAVISIAGDGGFMFAVQELATALQEDLAVVAIVFDNAAFGNVMRDQRNAFDNRLIGAALDNPDFVTLARAFGIEAHRVDSPETLRPVLKAALSAKSPRLIVVDVPQGSEVSPWPFIHPAA